MNLLFPASLLEEPMYQRGPAVHYQPEVNRLQLARDLEDLRGNILLCQTPALLQMSFQIRQNSAGNEAGTLNNLAEANGQGGPPPLQATLLTKRTQTSPPFVPIKVISPSR